MAGIKLLVMDLDGTLLNGRGEVSEGNCQAVRRAAAAGVVPVVASGRMREEAQFVVDALPEIRYFVGMNGGRVEDLHTGDVLYDRPMERDIACALVERLDEAGYFFQIYARGGVYCTRRALARLGRSGMSSHYLNKFGGSIKEWQPAMHDTLPAYKMLAVTTDPHKVAELPALADVGSGMAVYCSLPSLGYYEIVPAGVDKGPAVALLCESLGLAAREVLAIGDSENDVEMLRYAGKSAVVGNASPRLRDLADYIAPSNVNDGVAAAIEHFRRDGGYS